MEKEQYKWMVCVQCMTYNQTPYITDALNGFTMQETSFPYVCCIIDDASTDGEPEVIRKYLQDNFDLENKSVVRNEETNDYVLCFVQHKTNKNCYFAVLWLKYNHYRKKSKRPYISEWYNNAKYIAHCEGDDYWTLPTKLQIQVDYLESHPNVVLSCHRFTILDVNTGKKNLMINYYFDVKKFNKETDFEFDINYYLQTWITKTLTNIYRRSAIKDDYYVGYKYARDVHFNYYVLKNGYGVCHSFNGGVYRKNVSTSIFGNLRKNEQTNINCKVYEELAEVTQDPAVRAVADRLIVADCMNRLKTVSGGFFYVLKFLYLIDLLLSIVKRGFKRGVPPISLYDCFCIIWIKFSKSLQN